MTLQLVPRDPQVGAPMGTGPVVAIGNFDGVHLGHQSLVGAVVSKARCASTYAAVVIFDPHPLEVLRPEEAPARLTSIDHRTALLKELGVDYVCVLGFTPELANWEPETFVNRVLGEHLHASEVQVGQGFRFGRHAAGDVGVLKRLGEAGHFKATTRPLLPGHSSTRVRELIARGDMWGARRMLGRPHRLPVRMTRGHGAIGTADRLQPFAAPPRRRYDVVVEVDGYPPRRAVAYVDYDRDAQMRIEFSAADHVRAGGFVGRSGTVDFLGPRTDCEASNERLANSRR